MITHDFGAIRTCKNFDAAQFLRRCTLLPAITYDCTYRMMDDVVSMWFGGVYFDGLELMDDMWKISYPPAIRYRVGALLELGGTLEGHNYRPDEVAVYAYHAHNRYGVTRYLRSWVYRAKL